MPKCSKSFSFREFRPLAPTGGSALWTSAGGSAPRPTLQASAFALAIRAPSSSYLVLELVFSAAKSKYGHLTLYWKIS